MSAVTLEDAVVEFDTQKDKLVSILNRKREQGSSPYYKYQLTNRIAEYFAQRGAPLQKDADSLYGAVNKEPLKRVAYGMQHAHDLPAELLRPLQDWDKIYLMAGIWAAGWVSPPKAFNQMSTPEIMKWCIGVGRGYMIKKHNDNGYKTSAHLPKPNGKHITVSSDLQDLEGKFRNLLSRSEADPENISIPEELWSAVEGLNSAQAVYLHSTIGSQFDNWYENVNAPRVQDIRQKLGLKVA